ncbi:S1 RNA-binding domain-containing protein [Streptomyces sp. NPDC015346]|uniref:S1 RNA-binding domain-containing protein n=1 Tax=Streptomyces sp. NPDC015346 TaxID=3364954 RepID=UPI0036FF54BF
MERGDVRVGVVSRIASFHVTFVELGGVEGMMNIPEVSWGFYDVPGDVIAEGQELAFEVLAVDRSRDRIFLSLKALEPDPLAAFARGGFGGVRTGRVTRTVPSGVFLLVADGVEAYVDAADLDGGSPRAGDELTFEVTGVNRLTRRVRITLRG